MHLFGSFVARHGEVVVQAIVENFERFHGIDCDVAVPLEARWERLFEDSEPSQDRILAA